MRSLGTWLLPIVETQSQEICGKQVEGKRTTAQKLMKFQLPLLVTQTDTAAMSFAPAAWEKHMDTIRLAMCDLRASKSRQA